MPDTASSGFGRSAFPLSEALAFSVQSVRIRLRRMFIVLGGVALAVAFLTSLYTMGGLISALPAEGQSGLGSLAEMRKWWMVVGALIAVTGITNSMLMSVTERVKEIGTLKCLGATWFHILEVFLFEAAFLGLLGGLLGAVFGTGLGALSLIWQLGFAQTKTALLQWNVYGVSLLWGTLISVVLCLVSSVYPVYYAARIEAAEALRYEI